MNTVWLVVFNVLEVPVIVWQGSVGDWYSNINQTVGAWVVRWNYE